MSDPTDRRFPPFSGCLVATLGYLIGAILPQQAWSQKAPPSTSFTASQPAPSEAAPPAEPPPRDDNPGLIDQLGKLITHPTSMLPSLPSMKGASDTIDDLNAGAKSATDSLTRLGTSSMVSGRVSCPVSANGAPDCKTASDLLCQSKGFKAGKSLATDSAQKCSAKVLIPGRARKPDDCRTENFVTRALCE
jgi:hypothetical protein